jgi:UDP-2,3-diacylglucosamine hydrolase
MTRTLGIIAGGGSFPITVARTARERGESVIGVGFSSDTDPAFPSHCDSFSWLRLGQLGRLIEFFTTHHVTHVVMAGPINKPRALDLRPDWRAAKLLFSIKARGDDVLLRALSKELEREGLTVVAPHHYSPQLLAPEGILTKRKPTQVEHEDIAFGWTLAQSLGQFDIGQCLVVKEKIVLAVEAIEGTDAAILRGGRLGGPGAVVVKRPKPTQDKRLDLPAFGLKTLQSMAEVGATCLAFEAEGCIFFEQDKALAFADSHRLTLIGLPPSD